MNIGRTAEPQITHYAPIDLTPPRHEPVEDEEEKAEWWHRPEEESADEERLPIAHIEQEKMLRPTMASHQQINQSTNNEWYTPGVYVDAARTVMGHIDLDPASCAYANETVRADRYYSQADDGLRQPWYGRVWMNPPYGREEGEHDSNQARWTRRIIDEYLAGNVKEAIVLVNAVPGNRWFAPLKDYPICFPDVRIRFYNETTRAGQPTHSNALVYLGTNIALFVLVFSQFGRVMVPVVAVSSAEYRIDISREQS
jgi:ParB family chromosome partitioning protein